VLRAVPILANNDGQMYSCKSALRGWVDSTRCAVGCGTAVDRLIPCAAEAAPSSVRTRVLICALLCRRGAAARAYAFASSMPMKPVPAVRTPRRTEH
jgi:hypothetical protein